MSASDTPGASPPAPPAERTVQREGGPAFFVAGIGASAGGLEAITELLENLSPQPGLAFIIAVHLDPKHKSHLPEILAKTTEMPVREVREGMTVRINEVYLIPPNTNMALTDGHLMLTPRTKTPGGHMPVDHLFRSLAAVQRGGAIGIVLSGGGSDGTLGLAAIKAEGGITFAQDEKSAKQASMPRAASLDGTVDYVLRPADIARELERIARHPYSREVASNDVSALLTGETALLPGGPSPAPSEKPPQRSAKCSSCCEIVWASISPTISRVRSNAASSAAWLCATWRMPAAM